ncbi:MAG TPA: hypothetical protein VNW92_10065 [Polyangiaceae bacterium]|nr:hypothetical protein [Polyangiaceae bacterium]
MSLRLTLPRACPALLALVTSVVVLSSVHEAHASSGTAIGVDLDYTNGINEPGVSSGTGFDVRLGYKLDLLLAQITPEVGGGYHTFGGSAGATFSQGFVGGRLAFGKILEPGVYAHLGYGHVGTDLGGVSGATADAGLTLDLTLLPFIDLGVHGGYNGMLKSGDHSAFDTYVLGVQGALIF